MWQRSGFEKTFSAVRRMQPICTSAGAALAWKCALAVCVRTKTSFVPNSNHRVVRYKGDIKSQARVVTNKVLQVHGCPHWQVLAQPFILSYGSQVQWVLPYLVWIIARQVFALL